MERLIIHSDLNNFYASVERLLNPSLRGVPLAVCGNKEERRGIVLAKSEEAKRLGVATGDTVWQAKKKCPSLVTVPPHFENYIDFSLKVKAIYAEFTDMIESYGIDECWLDLTASTKILPKFFGDKYIEVEGERHFSEPYLRFVGDFIRNEVKKRLGLTVSVGVSFNKVFAKLGSDLKKPDGTTVISRLNYKNVVCGLPVEDLLMVGEATAAKLKSMGILTIGQLARTNEDKLLAKFGKVGHTLITYARGEDRQEVRLLGDERELKSIGNSMTCPRDLNSFEDVERTLFVLAESVASRLRESGLGRADTVHLWIRDSVLNSFTVQKKVRGTALCEEIANHALALFKSKFRPPFAIRSLGITVSGFDKGETQLTFDEAFGDYAKRERVERTVDKIRDKYGYSSIQRGIFLDDPTSMHNDVKNSHIIKPAKFDKDLPPDGSD